MTHEEELRLSQFRSDLLNILGNIYLELSTLRKEVRPARLFGEKAVEDLMELIADLIADDPARQFESADCHSNSVPAMLTTNPQAPVNHAKTVTLAEPLDIAFQADMRFA